MKFFKKNSKTYIMGVDDQIIKPMSLSKSSAQFLVVFNPGFYQIEDKMNFNTVIFNINFAEVQFYLYQPLFNIWNLVNGNYLLINEKGIVNNIINYKLSPFLNHSTPKLEYQFIIGFENHTNHGFKLIL